MKLNIIEDDDLRKEVRNLVIGQVKKILRDERYLNEIVSEAIKQEMKSGFFDKIRLFVKSLIKTEIIDNTRPYYEHPILRDWLKREIISSILTDIRERYDISVELKIDEQM